MDQNRFDDLTRALASSTSRRQALKLLGGGLLAALVPGSVFAKGGGNSDCAKFCASTFGANTRAAGQCTADAAKGKGLCKQCGSANPSSICCTRNANGVCSSYSGAHCACPTGQTCVNGTCTVVCPSDTTLCNGACVDTTSDGANCGGCGITCSVGHCNNSHCCQDSVGSNATCSESLPCCGGECQDGHCCLPPGGATCHGNDQCCSGFCQEDGVCGCPDGKVLLDNGSCATPCTAPGALCGSCGGGVCNLDASGAIYCLNAGVPGNGRCTSDINCPQGTFCIAEGLCASLC